MWSEDPERRKQLATIAVIGLPLLTSLLIIAAVHLAGGDSKNGGGGGGYSGEISGPAQPLRAGRPPLAAGATAPRMRLTDARTGRVLDTASLRGRPYAVTFISTRCRSIAASLRRAIGELGPAAARVSVLVVSTDPRGDTLQRVRRWLRAERMPAQLRYLIGPERQLRRYWNAWAVSPARGASCPDVDPVYLVDSAGQTEGIINAGSRQPSSALARSLGGLAKK